MRTTLALLAFTALLGAVRCDLVDEVQELINDFRALMPTGDAELDIPKLDPLSISKIQFSIKRSPFNAKIVAENIVATGASGFEIPTLSQRDDGKLSLSLEIPSINVTGDYDIDGKVKIGILKFKLSGNGPLVVSAGGIKGECVADVVENSNGNLHVNDLQIPSWSYDKLEVQLKGLGKLLDKAVNKLINKMIPSFIKSNKEKITDLIQDEAKSYINKYLDGISGSKSLRTYEPAQSTAWVISTEMQEMLNQLAKTIKAAQVAGR